MASDGATMSTTKATAASGPAASVTTLAPQLAADPAVQPVPQAGAAPERQRGCKTPPFGMKFNGDPKQLGFFLVQVWTYMQEYGPEIATEGSKVRCVTMALKGAASKGMVILHNDCTSELRNFSCFKHFKDSLANHKARDCIKTIS